MNKERIEKLLNEFQENSMDLEVLIRDPKQSVVKTIAKIIPGAIKLNRVENELLKEVGYKSKYSGSSGKKKLISELSLDVDISIFDKIDDAGEEVVNSKSFKDMEAKLFKNSFTIKNRFLMGTKSMFDTAVQVPKIVKEAKKLPQIKR